MATESWTVASFPDGNVGAPRRSRVDDRFPANATFGVGQRPNGRRDQTGAHDGSFDADRTDPIPIASSPTNLLADAAGDATPMPFPPADRSRPSARREPPPRRSPPPRLPQSGWSVGNPGARRPRFWPWPRSVPPLADRGVFAWHRREAQRSARVPTRAVPRATLQARPPAASPVEDPVCQHGMATARSHQRLLVRTGCLGRPDWPTSPQARIALNG
jgi:hypothetical protein